MVVAVGWPTGTRGDETGSRLALYGCLAVLCERKPGYSCNIENRGNKVMAETQETRLIQKKTVHTFSWHKKCDMYC